MTKTASELLQKYGEALGRPKKHDEVDVRNVYPFAQHINRKQENGGSLSKITQSLLPNVGGRVSEKDFRRYPSGAETFRHIFRMDHTSTKANAFGV